MASFEEMQEQVQDLILVLSYLTAWDENRDRRLGPHPMLTAQRELDFDSLNALDEDGLINMARDQQKFMLTREGRDRARQLIYEWGLQFPKEGPGI